MVDRNSSLPQVRCVQTLAERLTTLFWALLTAALIWALSFVLSL